MKKLFKLFFFLLLILIAILAINTLRFTSKQIAVAPVKLTPIDKDAVGRFATSLQFPTISNSNWIDTIAFDQFIHYLDSSFFLVDSLLEKEVINDYSLIYKWPGRNAQLKPILLIGHTDVVPVEEKAFSEWKAPPFSGKVENGQIWGRGALDDKIAVFSLLEAVQHLLKANFQPERSIYLAFGHDEEISGANGATVMAKKFKEEGIEFEFVLDEGMVVLEEAMAGLDKPVGLIGIAEKGYVTLNLSINYHGGHSSTPEKSTTLGIMSKALSRLEENPFPGKIDGSAKLLFDYVGPEMNFPINVVVANRWLFNGLLKRQLSSAPATNALIRTTTAITMIDGGLKDNVIPSQAEAKVNFRIKPGETIETVIAQVKQTIDDDRIEVSVFESGRNPSKVSSTESFGFQILHSTIKEVFPESVVSPALVLAGTDSRHYGIVSDNIYRFLPVQVKIESLHGIHGNNEYVDIEDYEKCIQFFIQLIQNATE